MARAAFYSCTAAYVIVHTHGRFWSHRFDDRKIELMLQRATGVMREVKAIIDADELIDTDLRVAVKRTHRKLRGVMKIVELSQRRDAKGIRKATLDRRERLHELYRNASTHAKLERNDLDGPENLQGRMCAGESADDTVTRAV